MVEKWEPKIDERNKVRILYYVVQSRIMRKKVGEFSDLKNKVKRKRGGGEGGERVRTDCSICGLEYHQEGRLRRHINSKHGDYIRSISQNSLLLQEILNNSADIDHPQPILISDESFGMLKEMVEKESEEEEEVLNTKKSEEIHSQRRRSNRIRKPVNYDEQLQKDDRRKTKFDQVSKKKSNRRKEEKIEVISIDCESEEEFLKEKLLITDESSILDEVLSLETTPVHPITPVSLKKEGRRKVKCVQCGGLFPNKSSLDRHVEQVHSLTCTKCPATIIFQTEAAFVSHNLRNHEH